MLPVIDYDDMVAAGMIKSASVAERDEHDKYAVILALPKTKIGKFCITTKEDTINSIEALSTNSLPPEIEKAARYYIKQAAIHFGIPASWGSELCPREINAESLFATKTAADISYRIEIAGDIFDLNSATQIKLAEEYFLGNIHHISIPDRCSIAKTLCKEGAFRDYFPAEEVKAYIHPHIYDISGEIAYRKNAGEENALYVEALEKIAGVYQQFSPVDFVENIRKIDKAAGLRPDANNHPYTNFFNQETVNSPDIDIKAISKVASVIADANDVDTIKLLSKIT